MADQDEQGSIQVRDVVNSAVVAIGHGASATVINNNFSGGPDDALERRNRRMMLDKVRIFWVEGVLEQSLHGAALIALGMEYKPDAVQYSWESILQQPDRPSQPLPHNMKMVDIFNQAGGELLILGAPGSGKTTLLLDLARDLIREAEQDEALPIPVVFNLSSWAEKRPPLGEWLVDELLFRYDVSRKLGKAWVKKDNLLLLLDGLDEVKADYRDTCLEAINHYRKDHGPVRLVVCSRSAEYETLRARLRLQSALVLQPLAREQAEAYLQSAGEGLAALRVLLQRDTVLQELAASPLILSIMALAYSGQDVGDLPELDSSEKWRRHLFDIYIKRMFKRRGSDKGNTPQQTIDWLSWLAQSMTAHSQTTFYLERMQPDWLPPSLQRVYAVISGLVAGLVVGLLGMLGGVLGSVLLGQPDQGWFFGLLGGAGGLLLGGVSGSSQIVIAEIKVVETLRFSWQSVTSRLSLGLLAFGLVAALLVGLFSGIFNGLVVGLSVGLLGLLDGFKIGDEIEAKTVPNQGIRRSARNAILTGAVSGLVSGAAFGLLAGLREGLNFGLAGGLLVGLEFGLAIGLRFGGLASIQHATLRLMLHRNGSIPLNYIDFLDYAAGRIFLRKVGGGYIFVHRLLMEHFASRQGSGKGH